MAQAKPAPPLVLDLEWEGGHRFRGRSGDVELVMDSPAGPGAPSPVLALAFGLAGCMAIDVALVLQKARTPLQALRVHLEAERAPTDPRRLVRVEVHFAVVGDVPADRMDRALELSIGKYCSVWHSLRPDIDLRTSYVIEGVSAPRTTAPS